ncbi:unnamed protein product [Ceutorhynchus assimilis]|uniref:Uncharacterized protein n=1 Tax=Ceutorhynchus assimilis TaxID=467358 RepID=A0A9N9MXV5_9CUCU|nr:unnamed protein product [Ceutorhynchus assimilis]
MTKLSEEKQLESVESSREACKVFAKRMLKTQLFIGNFMEKRYVDPLKAYRDVVKIDSSEKNFIQNILAVKKKVNKQLGNNSFWLGITEPNTVGAPVGYNLWVTLPIEVFGTYWFKVRTVEFLYNEIRLKLDVVRTVGDNPTCSASDVEDSRDFDLVTTVQDLSNNFKSGLFDFLKTNITLSNVKETVIFLTILTGTIIAGGINLVKYLMDYLLKFMREASSFIKVCTPIIISTMDLLRKMLHMLLAFIITLVHGKPKPQQQLQYQPYADPNFIYGNRRAIGYKRPRSSVTITPLD